MSPVYKLSANSVKNGRTVYGSMLAGNSAYVPPSWYDSLATVSVGSGGSSSISFTSIPSTYTHLQLRYITRNSEGAYYVRLQFNDNTTASNYSYHEINGNGSSVSASAGASSQYIYLPRNTTTSNTYGVGVIDILDYANTNKNKTVRAIGGYDANGSGVVDFTSGAFYQTTAISSIQLTALLGNFTQYSHFALYGIKVAS